MVASGEDPAKTGARAGGRVWTFADCVLDERSLELKVAGLVVDLDRKPMEVLLHLLRHAGEVVTKDELAEAVWPGRIVTDSNLTKTVAVVRAALGEAGQVAIRTVHGYGYRLVAPVSVRTLGEETLPARFQLRPGDRPPLRSDWRLSARLGAGGHGEVWLAHHVQSREARVFKFAEQGRSLAALKREITLNRLLRETLPGRTDFVRMLDWNVEQPPFFVESEYLPHGNLSAWAEAQGGLSSLPLERRLELMAQMAEAVASAHSVGVLHKDLKPGNVLVDTAQGEARIRLADFGCGAVVDPAALAAHGISRLGFTQTVEHGGDTSGTPVYVAPEVIAGQPFTVKSDVYALGVMLYQLVAGDTRKALAPGWEKDVPDELLREDVARAAAGDPADRLADAAQLAQQLRNLRRRRQEREASRLAQAELQRAQRSRAQLRRLQAIAGVLVLATGISAAAGLLAVRARDEARRAVATAEAVGEFLNRDVLASASPGAGATRDLSIRAVLDRAAATVDARFQDRPEAAAQVHATIAEAYQEIGELAAAQAHLDRAAALYAAAGGADSAEALYAQLRRGTLLWAQGRQAEACAMIEAAQAPLDAELAPDDPRRYRAQLAMIRCAPASASADDLAAARALAAQLEQQGLTGDRAYTGVLMLIAAKEFDREDYVEAERHYRELVEVLVRRHGARDIRVVRERARRAGALTFLGRLDAADAELERALADERDWTGGESGDNLYLSIWQTLLRLEQGRMAEAEALARKCLDTPLGRQRLGTFRLSALVVLAEALLVQGRVEEALRYLEESLDYDREIGGAGSLYAVVAHALQADAWLRQGRVQDAGRVLAQVTPETLAPLAPDSWRIAQLRRSEGLLWLRQGDAARGRAALQESLQIYQKRFGPGHWRTRRVRSELGAG